MKRPASSAHLGDPSGSRGLLLGAAHLLAAGLVAHALPRLSAHASSAVFIFYQPVFVALAMLWLWVGVIAFCERHAVKYAACFPSEHHRQLLSAADLQLVASHLTLLFTASLGLFAWACSAQRWQLAAWMPPLLYLAYALLLLLPADVLFREQRMFYATVLRRVMLPFQVRGEGWKGWGWCWKVVGCVLGGMPS